ncbi:MAG TPA: DUF1571 domain-containing protein [Urbifossiella sp.]|nr:DUF1571 domain-containing protein [Urbifossiella sp.]
MRYRFALLASVFLLAGCERYRTRAQGPFFPRRQPAPAPLPRDEAFLANPVPPLPPSRGAVEQPRPQEPLPPLPAQSPGNPPPTTAQPSPQAVNLAALKKISTRLSERLKTLTNYEARFARRENVSGKAGPLEEVIFRFRAEPMAVYMKNVSAAGKGREVLYNPSQYGEKVHVIVGEGDTIFLKAGSKAPTLSPDSPQVRSKSRHSIRESGIVVSGNKFIAAVAKLEEGKAPASGMKYLGLLKRDDLGDLPLEGVEQAARKDEQLPTGGTRQWFFDAKPDSPSFGLAVLVILFDASGKEMEYYRYTHLKAPAGLTDANFDPARLGKK